MPVRDGRMRGIRSIRERDFLLGRVRSWPDSTVCSHQPPVTLQSTHEAALDVLDLAGLKHRALELT
jgi:uncharacterized protein (DUF2237 family)